VWRIDLLDWLSDGNEQVIPAQIEDLHYSQLKCRGIATPPNNSLKLTKNARRFDVV
jgi:hypothetical protein